MSRPGHCGARCIRPAAVLDAEWTRVGQQKLSGDVLVMRKGDAIDYHQGRLAT